MNIRNNTSYDFRNCRFDRQISEEIKQKIDLGLLKGVEENAEISKYDWLKCNPVSVALLLQLLSVDPNFKGALFAKLVHGSYYDKSSQHFMKFRDTLRRCGYISRPSSRTLQLTKKGENFVNAKLSKKLSASEFDINTLLPKVVYSGKNNQIKLEIKPNDSMMELVKTFTAASGCQLQKKKQLDMAAIMTIFNDLNTHDATLHINDIIWRVFSLSSNDVASYQRLRTRFTGDIKRLEYNGMIEIRRMPHNGNQESMSFTLTDLCKEKLRGLQRLTSVERVPQVNPARLFSPPAQIRRFDLSQVVHPINVDNPEEAFEGLVP